MSDGAYLASTKVNPIERVARIARVGRIASGLLSEAPEASVMGVTSRGAFIRLASRWVIFLSGEDYCGPLTLNLHRLEDGLLKIAVGMPVRIEEGSIDFPGTGLRFDFDQAVVWLAPVLPPEILPIEQRRNQLVEVTRELFRKQKGGLFADFLAARMDDKRQSITPVNPVDQILYTMRMALLERNKTAFSNACEGVLGLGAGLTPSGDDLVAGLALALSRWGDVLLPDLFMEDLFAGLIPLAYRKTSLLSANLIECACLGQADERLVLALDGIMTGEYSPAQCASALAAWGSRSGSDALAGMALIPWQSPAPEGRIHSPES